LYADFEKNGPSPKLSFALSNTHIKREDVKFGKHYARVTDQTPAGGAGGGGGARRRGQGLGMVGEFYEFPCFVRMQWKQDTIQ
jgi:hypothetical protein